MKALFLPQTGPWGAASRYRVYQFIPYLERSGVSCVVHPGITDAEYIRLQAHPQVIHKCGVYARAWLRRCPDLFSRSGYDAIVLQREVVPHIFPLMELLLGAGGRLIFDFDDALFLAPPHSNGVLRRMRYASALCRIIHASSLVVCGNDYLAAYAGKFSSRVRVIPTCVDTEYFRPVPKHDDGTLTIGWVGSPHTFFYLKHLEPVLRDVLRMRRVRVLIVGAGMHRLAVDGAVYRPWRIETERELLAEIDIGISPLHADEWAQGKCGLKTVQYLACGIPAVVSATGVHPGMIATGENGFLATEPAAWLQALLRLIDDAELRRRMGAAARQTATARFSLAGAAPQLLDAVRSVAQRQ